MLVRRIYPLAPARLPGCQRENRNALGKLFRRLFRSHQHRPRPWPDHAAGLVAPGELGLRQFRHRRDGQHAGSGRAARRDDRRAPRRARRHAAADAVVPAHRGSLRRPAGAAAELPGMAVAAPADRRAAHRGVHPRGKLDQPVGSGEVAWPAGRAVRHRLRPQPTVRAGTADLHRYRRRPWLLVRRLPADCWLVAAAGPQRCAQGRSAQCLRARFVGLLPGSAGDRLGGGIVRCLRGDDPHPAAGIRVAPGLSASGGAGHGQYRGGGRCIVAAADRLARRPGLAQRPVRRLRPGAAAEQPGDSCCRRR